MITTRALTILGFCAIGIAFVLLHLIGRRPGSPIPTAGRTLGFLMRPRAGRLAILLAWWWIGWHFLAR